MENQSENCGKVSDASQNVCPDSGSVSPRVQTRPVTIEELLLFAQSRKLPLKEMRFFIGEDYAGAKAFGIYRAEDGNVVVYKNKADGSRAIRYEGPDEAFAVNEILQKMRAEIQLRRSSGGASGKARKSPKKIAVYAIVIAVVLICMIYSSLHTPGSGYYYYDDSYYYWDSGAWYLYDAYLDDWYPATADATLDEYYQDYWVGDEYQYDYGVSDFSQWDNPYSSSDDDWDLGDSWDVDDSWDIDITDWSSDW